MADFEYISGDPDNLTGSATANMVDIQGPLVDLKEWLNTDLQPRVASATPTFVTSLPSPAVNGQEVYYLADDTNGVVWHLRYRATSASAYKWEFVGGGAMQAEVLTAQTRNAATYADLTTVGPSITVPLAGEYDFTLESVIEPGGVAGNTGYASLSYAGSTPVDSDAIYGGTPAAAGVDNSASRTIRRTLAAASSVVKMQYKSTSTNNMTFYNRHLMVRPMRVG